MKGGMRSRSPPQSAANQQWSLFPAANQQTSSWSLFPTTSMQMSSWSLFPAASQQMSSLTMPAKGKGQMKGQIHMSPYGLDAYNLSAWERFKLQLWACGECRCNRELCSTVETVGGINQSCDLECVVHKVSIQRRFKKPPMLSWLMQQQELLFVEIGVMGSDKSSFRRTSSGSKLQSTRSIDTADINEEWIWTATGAASAAGPRGGGGGPSGMAQGFLLEPGSRTVVQARQEDPLLFNVNMTSEIRLQVLGATRTSGPLQYSQDTTLPMELLGEARFQVRKDVADVQQVGPMQLPVVVDSRIQGTIWVSVRLRVHPELIEAVGTIEPTTYSAGMKQSPMTAGMPSRMMAPPSGMAPASGMAPPSGMGSLSGKGGMPGLMQNSGGAPGRGVGKGSGKNGMAPAMPMNGTTGRGRFGDEDGFSATGPAQAFGSDFGGSRTGSRSNSWSSTVSGGGSDRFGMGGMANSPTGKGSRGRGKGSGRPSPPGSYGNQFTGDDDMML